MDPRLGGDEAGGGASAADQALGKPRPPRALHVSRSETCGIRIAPIGDDLHGRGVAASDTLGEIASDDHDPVESGGRQIIQEGTPVVGNAHIKERRVGK